MIEEVIEKVGGITELIGITAGICTTIAFFPQIVYCIKTGSANDLSLGMYIIFTTGVSLWLVYGFMLGAFSIIMANSVTLFFTSIILYIKVRNIIGEYKNNG